MIVKTEVWCVADVAKVELGLEGGDIWLPIAIDFRTLSAIKMAGDYDFIGSERAVLYFNGDHLTVNISYDEAIKLWAEALKSDTQ